MDTSDPGIVFDDQGVCSHCKTYDQRAQKELHYDSAGRQKFGQIVQEIKKNGRNKKYDCLMGVSGGVDSTMVAYNVVKLGLRPLAVHLDNGWDSKLAVGNIERVLKKLNIDLYTYVLDWEEFKDLQLAFLKSSTANCEIPTDHAITSLMYRTAARQGIQYIISGSNVVTEAIMPSSWGYRNKDWRHIRGIHKKFGTVKLRTFPHINLFEWMYYIFVRKIKAIPLLNYIPYVKKDAKELIIRQLGWQDYGSKHFESIYTRFFQAYILPAKFGFEKRRAHLSNLICSGQITRQEALEEMKRSSYPTEEAMKDDKEYVIKKLGIGKMEFERIMSEPAKNFSEYPNNDLLFQKFDFVIQFARRITTCNR
jgi:N-acetyl sugar amidotransferase